MSELALTAQDPAIAAADRRLWLLDLMIALCVALLRALKPNAGGIAWLAQIKAQAAGAISHAYGLAQALKVQTERALRALWAGGLPARPPRRLRNAPRAAPAAERLATLDWACPEPRADGDSVQAFRARLEALEAFLDQEAYGPTAELSGRQRAEHLCRVLGLNPLWSRWLGDGWLAANLNLTRPPELCPPAEPGMAQAPAPLRIPPPPAGEAWLAPMPLPAALLAAHPEIVETYEPGFRDRLGQRMSEAIETYADDDDHFTQLSQRLERRLAANEPYMWGGNNTLRGAVGRLCEQLRLWPEWDRWQGDRWIDDGFHVRRRHAAAEARLRAAGPLTSPA
ncbi:MAG TPA: hypothetical protein VIB82_07895 [Caulobacteraceae bacterium]